MTTNFKNIFCVALALAGLTSVAPVVAEAADVSPNITIPAASVQQVSRMSLEKIRFSLCKGAFRVIDKLSCDEDRRTLLRMLAVRFCDSCAESLQAKLDACQQRCGDDLDCLQQCADTVKEEYIETLSQEFAAKFRAAEEMLEATA